MFKVGDKIRRTSPVEDCKCGCNDIWTVIEIKGDYIPESVVIIKNNRTGKIVTTGSKFYNLVLRRETGFGKFIRKIECSR